MAEPDAAGENAVRYEAHDRIALITISRPADDPGAGLRLGPVSGLGLALAGVPALAASALERALTSRQRADLAASLDYESWLAGVAAKGAR